MQNKIKLKKKKNFRMVRILTLRSFFSLQYNRVPNVKKVAMENIFEKLLWAVLPKIRPKTSTYTCSWNPLQGFWFDIFLDNRGFLVNSGHNGEYF